MSHHDSDEENLPLLAPSETAGHYSEHGFRHDETESRVVDVTGHDFEPGYQNDLTQESAASDVRGGSRSQPNLTGQAESFAPTRGGWFFE